MAVLLVTALLITFRGGQISIMITDFFQAQFVNIVFLLLLFVLLWKFGISEAFDTMKQAPAGESLINPFDQAGIPDFNMFFFFILAFNAVYSYMAWQGNQGYNASAKSPHEAKMARILGAWRYGATWTVIMIIPIFAWVIMNSPSFMSEAAIAQEAINALNDEGLERQLTVPIILRQMLPVGVTGLFVAAMLAAAISTDDTYLHSWGSIFIQDVYLPLTGKKLSPEQHIGLLRKSIFGVAVFVWVFGMVFSLQEYIFMYWAITGAIYVGGAGSVIIGGFYWRHGTTAGAWAGMITGSLTAVIGVINNNIFWPNILPKLKEAFPDNSFLVNLPEAFPWDGAQLFFASSLMAIAMYIVFSRLSKPDPNFNMDRILNRGKFAVDEDAVDGVKDSSLESEEEKRSILNRLIGIDKHFTGFDKFISISILVWTLGWFAIFIVGTLIGLGGKTTDDHWARYWIISQGVYVIVGIITVFWFLIGGFRDLAQLFRTLKKRRAEHAKPNNEKEDQKAKERS